MYTEYHLRLAELAGVVEGDEIYQKAGHKGGQGRVQADDRFRWQRGLKAVGRGTWAQDRPPILGLAQRSQKDERGRVQERAHIYLEVLPNVQTETIRPVIKAHVLKGSTFNSDEYEIYNFTGREGYDHRIVNHSVGEYARGDDYVNTMEGIWSIVRPFLRCFRGVAKKCLHLRVARPVRARIEFLFNLAALSSREILHRVFEFCAMAPGRYLRWIVKQRRALPATGCYL